MAEKTTKPPSQRTSLAARPPLAEAGGCQREPLRSPDNDLLQLQRLAGNRATLGLLAAGIIQPKLRIGAPDDPLEREADRVADQVMRMQAPVARLAPISKLRPVGLLQLKLSCDGSTDLPSDSEAYRQDVSAQPQSHSDCSRGEEVFPVVHKVLSSPGQPLDAPARSHMEARFGYEFGNMRTHTDALAAESARSLNALAFTMRNHLVFAEGQYSPCTQSGQRLLAHELTHALQQGSDGRRLPLDSQSLDGTGASRSSGVTAAAAPVMIGSGQPVIARQPTASKSGQEAAETEPEQDLTMVRSVVGTAVSKIVIDLRRGRVGFEVPAPKGMIVGSVATDLKPGTYSVSCDPAKKRWVFQTGQVKSGLRFDVELEGANPWTLSYPNELPVLVGYSSERKGGGPSGQSSEDIAADLLRIFDEAPGDTAEDPTIDGFVDCEYAPKWEVKNQVGGYTTRITLKFFDGSSEQVDLAAVEDGTVGQAEKEAAISQGVVTEAGHLKPKVLNRSTTPHLWELKQKILKLQLRLKQLGEAELLDFTLEHAFPAVFTIITINPFVAPMAPSGGAGMARRPPLRTPLGAGSKGPPSAGKPVLAPAENTRVLLVGGESEAEFAWARSLAAKAQRVDVVNTFESPAATTFKAEGGNFISGKLESLPNEPTYNLIREDFPFPTGKSIETIEAVGQRLSRLKPGGRCVFVTEEEHEFLPTLVEAAERRGARVSTYSVPKAHEEAPQSTHPKQHGRFVVIIDKP